MVTSQRSDSGSTPKKFQKAFDFLNHRGKQCGFPKLYAFFQILARRGRFDQVTHEMK